MKPAQVHISTSLDNIVLHVYNMDKATFTQYLDIMRGINAKYNVEEKLHYIKIYSLITLLYWLDLYKIDVVVSSTVSRIIARGLTNVNNILFKLDERQVFLSSNRMFPFQIEGSVWLESNKKGLLCDEMGVGKTIQALMAIPEGKSIFVICPSIAKRIWYNMALDWRPDLTPIILEGRQTEFPEPVPNIIHIANFEIILKTTKDRSKEYDVLILDECHMLKSYKAQRTKRVRELANQSKRVWALTGTPLLGKHKELWCALLLTKWHTKSFDGYLDFQKKMSIETIGYKQIIGNPTQSGIIGISQGMLRRLKIDVLKDLPNKIFQQINVHISKDLSKQCDEVIEILQNKYGDNIDRWLTGSSDFSQLSRLRSDLATGKIEAMLEIVENFENNETPLVVFSYHRAPIEELSKRDGWRGILSGISKVNVNKYQDEFQEGKLKGIALTIGAGGTAITLTKGSHVLFIDLDWTPALNSQATDRLHRLGQKNCVNIYIITADHNIDRLVNTNLLKKMELIDNVIEGVSSAQKNYSIKKILENASNYHGDDHMQKSLKTKIAVNYMRFRTDTKIYIATELYETLDKYFNYWSTCSLCKMSALNTNTLHTFYKFYLPCDILMIGEGPGKEESRTGIPFIGPAGNLFSSALIDAGFTLGERPLLGFTNVVSCRPTKLSETGYITNRQPEPTEISNCLNRLKAIIKIANPSMILAVGKVALSVLDQHKRILCPQIPYTYLLHPSYVLRKGGEGSQEYSGFVKTLYSLRTETPCISKEEPSLFD